MTRDQIHVALIGPMDARALAHHFSSTVNIPGGPPTPVNELAEGLLSLGHRVSVYTPLLGPCAPIRLSSENLTINFIPHRSGGRARNFFREERRHLERELKSSDADVVHVHWTYELALAALKSKRKPLIVTAHDAPFTILRYTPDAYRLVRTLIAVRVRLGTTELTAVSPYLASCWRKQMWYRRPISVIPNFLPELPASTQPNSRRRWAILEVADDSRRKNVRTLIRAFASVVKRHPNAELRLVGPGLSAHDPIAEWARSRRLDTNVTFVGRVDRAHIANEYERASIFCHASLEESHGVSLIEALSSGLAVIAGKRSGGVPWALFEGQAGRLIDMRDPAVIASAVSEVLEDPSSTVSTGFDVAQAINDRHAPAVVAGAYLDEYLRIIDAKRSDDG